MSINRIWLRGATMACIAGLCMVALASCGGGGGRGGGAGGGSGGNPTTTMQITPVNAGARSLSQAQAVELPSEQEFNATLTGNYEDQQLVYGFGLDTGDMFGTEIAAENGQSQIIVRFYNQNGEEMPVIDLPEGGVGFEAPATGNYYMAIGADSKTAGALARSDDSPQVVPIVIAIIVRWAVITGGRIAIAQARKLAVKAWALCAKDFQNCVNKIIAVLTRADLAVAVDEFDCSQHDPVRPGDRCTFTVHISNVGGRIQGLAQGVLSHPPPITHYLHTDRNIALRDSQGQPCCTVVGTEYFEQSAFEDLVWIGLDFAGAGAPPLHSPHVMTVTMPDTPGTYYYGACVAPIYLERGVHKASVGQVVPEEVVEDIAGIAGEVTGVNIPTEIPLTDLTGNNCSEAVEVVVVPTLSVADAGSVIEGRILEFTVSFNGASGQPITVDWGLSFSSEARRADFAGATSGTLNFNPGESSKTITLTTRDDQTIEGSETVVIKLSNPQNSVLDIATANGTILDIASLHTAAQTNDANAIRALVAAGANVNELKAVTMPASSEYKYLADPLTVAASYESMDAIQALLDAGADVNAKYTTMEFHILHGRGDYAETTPLIWAAANNAANAIRALTAAGANVNAKVRNGNTALHSASKILDDNRNSFYPSHASDVYVYNVGVDVSNGIRALLAAGASINEKNDFGWTPLFVAVRSYNLFGVRALTAAGASAIVEGSDSLGLAAIAVAQYPVTSSDSRSTWARFISSANYENTMRREAYLMNKNRDDQILRALLVGGANPNRRVDRDITYCDFIRVHSYSERRWQELRFIASSYCDG